MAADQRSKTELPLLTFADGAAFKAWLAAQPSEAPGAWLRFAKAGAPEATLTKSEAIDSALAYGWIDGQLGKIDEAYFKVRFTPRRRRSAWSQNNRDRVQRLIDSGRMTARGMAEVEQARADGRWQAAYAGQAKASAPPDLVAALAARPKAQRFFESLDAANRYAVLYRVQQAKGAERRVAKIAELVARLARGEAFHPRKMPRG